MRLVLYSFFCLLANFNYSEAFKIGKYLFQNEILEKYHLSLRNYFLNENSTFHRNRKNFRRIFEKIENSLKKVLKSVEILNVFENLKFLKKF